MYPNNASHAAVADVLLSRKCSKCGTKYMAAMCETNRRHIYVTFPQAIKYTSHNTADVRMRSGVSTNEQNSRRNSGISQPKKSPKLCCPKETKR